MGLSYELLSQFAKLVTKNDNANVESTVYGTIVVDSEGNKYVKLDGSDQLTPLSDNERPVADSTTANANEGERVSVLIKNHTATVTGNVSSPAARSGDVEQLGDHLSKIQEFDILIGEQIQAQEGYIQQLQADKANVADLTAAEAKITELETKKATVEELNALKIKVDDIEAANIDAEKINAKFIEIDGELTAVNADIDNLNVDYGTFKEITTDKISGYDAEFERLETEKLSSKDAEIHYANIDFANIGEAAFRKIFSDTGLIKDLVVGDSTITGELVGVTLKGDLIEAGTLKADKLVVKGSDGIYYKLNIEAGATTSAEVTEEELQNGLHGTAIIAKTITAEKIAVDDLVAFDATIGGFNITESAIYSGVKEAALNTTRGVYLDRDGQLSVGDADNYLRYYKTEDGNYKLEISAESLTFGTNKKNIEDAIEDAIDGAIDDAVSDIKIGARNYIRNSKDLIFSDYYFSGELVATDDGNGNVTITCGASAVVDNDGNVSLRASAVATDDSAGNVNLQ